MVALLAPRADDGGMTDQTIRLALFGAGRWARVAHVASLLEVPGVRIEAVASSDGGSARALLDELGGRELFAADAAAMSSDDLAVALPGGGFDAVVIASPPGTHAELASAALGAGLPVLCELPLATDPGAARELASAAEAAGVLAATTLPRPLLYGSERVAALLGELGELQRAKLTVRLPKTPMPMLVGLAASALTTLFGPGRALAQRTLSFEAHERMTALVDLAAEAPGPDTGFTGLDVEGARGILRWSWSEPGKIMVDRKDDEPDEGPRDESVPVEPDLGKAFPFTRRFIDAVRAGDAKAAGLPSFRDGARTLELAAGIGRALQG